MTGRRRKKGDWVTVARGRVGKIRELAPGRGLSNIPSPTEVGSAAYRRAQASGRRTR